MTRTEAREIAKQAFKALNTANMNYWMGRGEAPVEADYSYRHGWIHMFGYAFRSDEISDGVDQPIMD